MWTDNSNYICKKESKTTGHHLKSREPRGQKWNILFFRDTEDYPLILSTDYSYNTLRQCRCHTHIIQESHHFSNVQTTHFHTRKYTHSLSHLKNLMIKDSFVRDAPKSTHPRASFFSLYPKINKNGKYIHPSVCDGLS